MKKTLKTMVLLAGMLAAGGASAATHSVGTLSALNTLLNGNTLANGDVIEITADITMTYNLTVSKQVTIRSASGAIRTIRSRGAYIWIKSQVTVANITFDGESVSGSNLFYLNASGYALTLDAGTTIQNVYCDTGYSPIRMTASGTTLTINDGAVIENCKAAKGGAINNSPASGNAKCGTITMNGGRITGCTATSASSGGAIYTTGDVIFSGACTVVSNTAAGVANNVQPYGNSQVRLGGTLTGSVGVTYGNASEGVQFGTFSSGTGASAFFHDSNPVFKGAVSGSNLVWKEMTVVLYPSGDYTTFADAVAEAAAGTGEIELTADITEDLTSPAGSDITIDLKGHTVTGGITALGNVTVTDSSAAKSGEVTGALVASGGTFTLEWGTYATKPADAWLAADRIAVANTDGTFSVTKALASAELGGMALDTRMGQVRVVNDLATDLLPITYSSGMWVLGASTNDAKRTGVYLAAVETEAEIAVWHDGTNTVADAADGDGTYTYDDEEGIWEVGESPRLQLFDGHGESAFEWQPACWGLVKTVHSNETGVLEAYFKLPDLAFDVIQRSSVTNVYAFIPDSWVLEGLGVSRIGNVDRAAVEARLNAMKPNGLRLWENIVAGVYVDWEDDSVFLDYLSMIDSNEEEGVDTMPIRMDSIEPSPVSNYLVFYELRRRETNGWTRVHGPQDGLVEYGVYLNMALHSDDTSGEHDVTGLYRLHTLLVPDTNLAITNDIPATNIFGVLRVDSVCTNTITANPWKRLASVPELAEDMDVADLPNLSANNLAVGDRLYAYDNAGGLFYGWSRVAASWKPSYSWWEGMLSVTADGVTTEDETVSTLPRGGAFWMVRADPCQAGGGAKPYFVCGQHQSGAFTNTIAGGSAASPHSTILANPTPQAIAISNLTFVGTIGANDTLAVPTVTPDVPNVYRRNAANTEWGYSKQTVSRGQIRNTWITAGEIPRGTGFWYVRRAAGDLKIVWPAWEE